MQLQRPQWGTLKCILDASLSIQQNTTSIWVCFAGWWRRFRAYKIHVVFSNVYNRCFNKDQEDAKEVRHVRLACILGFESHFTNSSVFFPFSKLKTSSPKLIPVSQRYANEIAHVLIGVATFSTYIIYYLFWCTNIA